MQGEIYTEAAFGQHGSQEFSVEKLLGPQAITTLRVVLRENPVAWAAYDAPLG